MARSISDLSLLLNKIAVAKQRIGMWSMKADSEDSAMSCWRPVTLQAYCFPLLYHDVFNSDLKTFVFRKSLLARFIGLSIYSLLMFIYCNSITQCLTVTGGGSVGHSW